MNRFAKPTGIYLRILPYESRASVWGAPENRAANQDAMIFDTMRRQEKSSNNMRNAANAEATVNSRYGLLLQNYMQMLTSFPELLMR